MYNSEKNNKLNPIGSIVISVIILCATIIFLIILLKITQIVEPILLKTSNTSIRYGLPVAKTIHNIAAATTIGSLLFAATILPKNKQNLIAKSMGHASIAATTWTISAIITTLLTYVNISGTNINLSESFTQEIKFFILYLPVGQAWAIITLFTATITVLCYGLRSQTAALTLLIASLAALIPLALIGHAAGSNSHEAAVNSLGLHLIGSTLWVGGLISLLILFPHIKQDLQQIVSRYSTIALIAFMLLFFSGIINASIRIGTMSQLNTSYGTLILAKTSLTIILGIIGFIHRTQIIQQLSLQKKRKSFIKLATIELAIMGIVIALAVTLASSPTPVPDGIQPNATPAEILTSYPLPPEPTFTLWFSMWRINVLWATIAIILGYSYLLATIRLKKRQDKWPIYRTISWILGLISLIYVTSGGVAIYGKILFSAHMIGHMLLTMVVPIFLVIGAPVTLLLKVTKKRQDGSLGIREWSLKIVQSKYSNLITHPIVAAMIFIGSIPIFYYTQLFGLAITTHIGHELMNAHFLISGYLFALALVGTDPVHKRASYPMRILLLLATMAFHAFFGVTLMQSESLLQASFFGSTGRDWGESAIVDQQIGGAVAWGIGEIPTILIAMLVVFLWSRSDAKETRRLDRAAELNNDKELQEYNEMLRNLK